MGLDMSHDCWSGPYSAFHRFRKKICEVAGYGDLNEREGFVMDKPGIPWPTDDPLVIFLSHSDCDGEIAAADCGPIADCIEALLPSLERAGSGGGYIWSYAGLAEQLIAGLRLAASKDQMVRFR